MIFLNEDTDFLRVSAGSADAAELDEMLVNEGITVPDVFSEDHSGAIEICLEAETAWAALAADMFAIEHKAIVNEDVEILNEGLKEWWTAIINFFKRVWAAISGWFRKAWDWLLSKFQNAEKWYKANAKNIKVASTEYDTYPAVAKGNLDKASAEFTAFSSIDEADKKDVKKAIEKYTASKIFTDYMGAESTSNMTVSKAAVEKILTGSNASMARLKSLNNKNAAFIKAGIKVAEAGLKTSNANETKKLKTQVETGKALLRWNKMLISAWVKIDSVGISHAFGAAKKMLRESGASK